MPPDGAAGDGDDDDDDGHGHAYEHKTWDAGRTDGRTKETEEENKQLGSAGGRRSAGRSVGRWGRWCDGGKSRDDSGGGGHTDGPGPNPFAVQNRDRHGDRPRSYLLSGDLCKRQTMSFVRVNLSSLLYLTESVS